jgi:hypothetical protein
MYRLIVESLLGLRLAVDRLHVAPLVPPEWDAFAVHYRHRRSLYHIHVRNLASMRGAEELGAAQVPPAALQLQLAQEELERARRLMDDGKNDRAHAMALRAVNDAELAIALTREAQARQAVEQAKQGVDAQTPEVTP